MPVEPLRLSSSADVFIPDGAELDAALARTTDLAIGAHPDDLELLALVPIGECLDATDRWLAGVTCTDGAGSATGGSFAGSSPDELAAVRRDEQRRAATLGRYGAMVQLGHRSADVRAREGFDRLVDELATVLAATHPGDVYTHNLADKHDTHVAVAMATVAAVRRLDRGARPRRLLGVEGWRDLDWLPDGEKVRLDASAHAQLGAVLAEVFASQLEGAKRYDVAVQGRRRANATLFDPRAVDAEDEVVVAMDLTPLAHDDALDPTTFVLDAIDRFRDDVERRLRAYG